ncbi:hypothetical protein [Leisingera sp. NJS204]|uniref:hypothetical protein n=1 Tax=Leisingera sp. NJS204 TaxID=2508307 RepID=UPI0020C75822|nr:hypothetical protein [Leisingera sp. NJS204]
MLRQSDFALDDVGAGLDRAVFVSSPVVVEGNGGTRKAYSTIRLSEPAASSLTLDYRTKNGNTIAGEDCIGAFGYSHDPGQRRQQRFTGFVPDLSQCSGKHRFGVWQHSCFHADAVAARRRCGRGELQVNGRRC